MDPLKWALKAWQANLKVHYKITHMDYEKLLRGQKGRCAICKSLTPGQNHKHFCIDHSHKTGKIRGLLCHKCNHGIGSFDDKPKLLQQAIYYLKGGK
jgi:hypothetical protein